MTSKLYPIPGYEDLYWVDPVNGTIFNKSNHQIKPMQTDKGAVVELRKYGQRERLFVREIVIQTMEANK